ncbi:hypothetical protein COOONC_06492 [Cooperia oncophora]
MLFVLLGLCFVLANANVEYPDALAKCITYRAQSDWFRSFNRMYNPNLEWNNELSYEACYDLVGIEPNNIYVRLDGQRKFSGEERNWPLSKKVRLALRAGGGKDKVNALAPETIYGCNGLFEGDILKVLCLYRG